MATSDYILGTIAGSGGASTNSLIITHTLAAGDNRVVVAYLCGENGADVNSVFSNITYNSDAQFTKAIESSNSIGEGISLWYVLDSDLPGTPGNYPVRAYSATSTNHTAAYLSVGAFQGIAQEAPQTTAEIISSAIDITIDPVSAGAVLVGGAGISSSNYPGLTAGSDTTTFQVQQLTLYMSTIWGARIAPASDATTMYFNSADANNASQAIALSLQPYTAPPPVSGAANNAILFSISI